MNEDMAQVEAMLLEIFSFTLANLTEDQIARATADALTTERAMDNKTGIADPVFTGRDLAKLRQGLLAGFKLAKEVVV
jgi:hypothetical protein